MFQTKPRSISVFPENARLIKIPEEFNFSESQCGGLEYRGIWNCSAPSYE
jgi:hypothetical protein